MKKLFAWLKWIDNHLLKILLLGFIFIAPLYPKLPIRMIDYTYIALRFEDIYLAVLYLIFFLWWLRKKVKLNLKFLWLFIAFWSAISLSTIWGIYISKTIIFPHLGWLHTLRRIEYMTVFLVTLSVIKTKKDFTHLFASLLLSFFLTTVYGIGQKFLGWPAVQTMNPEYAKGYLLFLTPEARISSTFAGHYDLAAYLIFLLPIVLGYYLLRNKLRFFFLFLLGLVVLIFTASRVSYIAYVASIFPFIILMRKPKIFLIILLFTVGLTSTSKNLTSRLKRSFQVKRILVDEKTGAVYIPQKITAKELPAGSFYVKLKDQKPAATTTDENFKKSIIADKRIDLKNRGLSDNELATLEANLKPVDTVVSDISLSTRFQVEWPRALEAFKKNILLGTGPSSITEATDNDYLRWLGEFGLLGTIAFLLILFKIIQILNPLSILKQPVSHSLTWGYFFGLAGLLINASYIDVFEASKVAYTFWVVSGLFASSTLISNVKNQI